MEQRKIGSLEVSVVGLGCNNFGRRVDVAGTRAVIDACLDAGVNFLDTADVYGESEDFLGEVLEGRRDRFVIATKFGGQFSENAFTNTGKFVDPRIEEALLAGEAATEIEDRAAAYTVINEVLIEQAFNVPLYYLADIVAYNNRVKGFVPNLLAKPRFDGVSLGE